MRRERGAEPTSRLSGPWRGSLPQPRPEVGHASASQACPPLLHITRGSPSRRSRISTSVFSAISPSTAGLQGDAVAGMPGAVRVGRDRGLGDGTYPGNRWCPGTCRCPMALIDCGQDCLIKADDRRCAGEQVLSGLRFVVVHQICCRVIANVTLPATPFVEALAGSASSGQNHWWR
jgi:hypothetical protein